MTSPDRPPARRYGLHFMPEALAELDGSVRAPLKKLLAKRLDKPHVPGDALQGARAGCYKIKPLKQGVRLVYAVDKREDGVAYGAATGRRLKAGG